jgi:hypothetical protein
VTLSCAAFLTLNRLQLSHGHSSAVTAPPLRCWVAVAGQRAQLRCPSHYPDLSAPQGTSQISALAGRFRVPPDYLLVLASRPFPRHADGDHREDSWPVAAGSGLAPTILRCILRRVFRKDFRSVGV